MHRDFYLRNESTPDHSSLAPMRCSRDYGNDCMRNSSHAIGWVKAEENLTTTPTAMTYRRYHDATCTPTVGDKIAAAANQPPWDRPVPGVGDMVSVHVRNAGQDQLTQLPPARTALWHRLRWCMTSRYPSQARQHRTTASS